MKLFPSISLLLGFAIFSAANASGGLIGSDFSGVIYDVDPATGACTSPRSTGLSQVAGFTVTADGQYGYALTSFGSSPPNALFSVNPATGDSTFLGNTGLNLIGEGDLCIRPSDGTLFGLWNIVGSSLHMFTLNATTGVATDIGAVASSGDFSGLAFAPDGSLYAFENTSSLHRLDPATGATLGTINLSGLSGTTTGAAGLAFAPDGTLYLACGLYPDSSLYTVDLPTGAAHLAGPTTFGAGYGLSSLTFIVPEPSVISLLLPALAACCWQFRRRNIRD
jgi:hypothetical protein